MGKLSNRLAQLEIHRVWDIHDGKRHGVWMALFCALIASPNNIIVVANLLSLVSSQNMQLVCRDNYTGCFF